MEKDQNQELSHVAADLDAVQVMEIPDYQYLPEDVLLQIFELLDYRDLYSVGTSCQKFYRIAETFPNWIGGPSLDTKDFNLNMIGIIPFLLEVPDSVRRLRISAVHGSPEYINFFYLSLVIYLRFPYLEELHLNGCRLDYNPCNRSDAITNLLSYGSRISLSEINELRNDLFNRSLCVILPQCLRLLSFRNYTLMTDGFFYRLTPIRALPNLKVLDFYQPFQRIRGEIRLLSSCTNLTELYLGSRMSSRGIEANSPYLKKLKVFAMAERSIEKQVFGEMLGHFEELTELHLCNSALSDDYLDFINENTLPHLEILCLLRSNVTKDGIEKLFSVCHSLNTVYGSVYVDSETPVKRYGMYIRSSEEIPFIPFENIDDNTSEMVIYNIIKSHYEKYNFRK